MEEHYLDGVHMEITQLDLMAFVAKSDELGGPDHPATLNYWANFSYKPTVVVDTTLPPDGDEYLFQMLKLYEEVSGRRLEQKSNELTELNVEELIELESPYAFQTPSNRATHYLRIAKTIQIANLARGASVLDMGCGWGLSSELLAELGFEVSAIDINPLFVELVRRRAHRLGLKIRTAESSFDEYLADPLTFDAVLFYECFHHAVNPNALLRNMYSYLKQHGKLILAGEPIQDLWWPNWGLRLDALSVYCIRKFGWFESGWSESYLKKILSNNNFIPMLYDHPDPTIGKFVIATKEWRMGKDELVNCALKDEWWIEDEWLVSNRVGNTSTLNLTKPIDARMIVLDISNFSPGPLDVAIKIDGVENRTKLGRGLNRLSFDCSSLGPLVSCRFSCEPWSPKESTGSNDNRYLGFHLKQICFDHGY